MTTRIAWCTDVHLDHLKSEKEFHDFTSELIKSNPSRIIITGDISTAKNIVYHMSAIEKATQRPIYFVLGNHDFFEGSIIGVRKQMRELVNVSSYLKYMSDPDLPYVGLTETTALVGHDGWYDLQHGHNMTLRFLMNDWRLISEYAGTMIMMRNSQKIDRDKIVDISRKLAHEGASHVQNGIKHASKHFKNIIVMTHVPPFAESSRHLGRPSDPEAAGVFTSKIMGDVLLSAAQTYPHINFTVLAGHTHDPFNDLITPNLRCIVGAAEYEHPRVELLEII